MGVDGHSRPHSGLFGRAPHGQGATAGTAATTAAAAVVVVAIAATTTTPAPCGHEARDGWARRHSFRRRRRFRCRRFCHDGRRMCWGR